MKRGRDGSRNSWTRLPVLTSTLFSQGRVAFTNIFSRRENNAKDLESFASEKGCFLLMIEIFFFDAFSMTLFGSFQKTAQKAAQKAATFQRCFDEWVFYDRAVFQFQQNKNSITRTSVHYIFSAKKLQKQFFLGRE